MTCKTLGSDLGVSNVRAAASLDRLRSVETACR